PARHPHRVPTRRSSDLLVARGDPRLDDYFAPNLDGDFVGADPGQTFNATHSLLSATRGAPEFRQPLITWAENQLNIAEAAFQTGDRKSTRLNSSHVKIS